MDPVSHQSTVSNVCSIVWLTLCNTSQCIFVNMCSLLNTASFIITQKAIKLIAWKLFMIKCVGFVIEVNSSICGRWCFLSVRGVGTQADKITVVWLPYLHRYCVILLQIASFDLRTRQGRTHDRNKVSIVAFGTHNQHTNINTNSSWNNLEIAYGLWFWHKEK